MTVFSQKQSLGNKSPSSIAKYLRSIGDDEAADRFVGKGAQGQSLLDHVLGVDQYAHTGILLGYIAPGQRHVRSPIENAVTLEADSSLKGGRIKITLDRFYVQSYPGFGTHSVLCEFSGKNQIHGESEELRYAISTEVNDESSAAVLGAPIFLGVSVGQDGIAFEGRTVNVCSKNDDTLMEALGSDAFKNGLALLTSVQPALKPFVGLAGSVVKSIATRSKNCQVYAFKLGLDFGVGTTSARLRIGSYAVVQADAATWDWSKLAWDAGSQSIVNKTNGEAIKFNYMVFGVSKFIGSSL